MFRNDQFTFLFVMICFGFDDGAGRKKKHNTLFPKHITEG